MIEIPVLTDVAQFARQEARSEHGELGALAVLLAAGHQEDVLVEARDACAYYAVADPFQDYGWFDAVLLIDQALHRLILKAA